MSFTIQPNLHYFFLLLLILASSSSSYNASENQSVVSTIMIFGDSTVDSGNNNYIPTIAKSNFPPYGKDFVDHVPTGRFSNGRLVTDFVANYLGIKENVPPYLDPTLSLEERMTGVSFASAASGQDPLTAAILVYLKQPQTYVNIIPVLRQLEELREYKSTLEETIGHDQTNELINNALFIVSAGTNDFVINYFALPIRRINYTIPAYMDFLLGQTRVLLQGLMDQGARLIGVAGLPPMGCLPLMITVYSGGPNLRRDCVSNFSSIARDYNKMLRNELNNMQLQLQTQGIRIVYLDIYTPLEDMILGRKYGFEEVSKGCCGTGLLEVSFLCNALSIVCEDADEYVFWDSVHPSQKAYDIIFQSLRPIIDTMLTKTDPITGFTDMK
ncbi:hypothetical protein CASFOL_039458 [Castilleja foliolosa]|uniref:GDSL esterase/lipase n=1 Tax=Castilleja foliolosa TaxID=1961234 RepID=A0ABD3BIM5_9LAMI